MYIKQAAKQNIKVNLHIVGVQKAGTSALAHFLSQHPDICLVDGKEAHVFDQPDFYETEDKKAFADKRYAKKLPHYDFESIICDATPITLFNPVYMQACVEYNPEALFIVLLRDPVERAQSHYKMMRKLGREDKNMLSAFLSESSRLSDHENFHWSRTSPWRHWSYLHRGLYKQQLDMLYSLVRPEQVLVLKQEDLLEHHEATLARVFDFIGLPEIRVIPEQVFESDPEPFSFVNYFAKCYAKAFFAYHKLRTFIK